MTDWTEIDPEDALDLNLLERYDNPEVLTHLIDDHGFQG